MQHHGLKMSIKTGVSVCHISLKMRERLYSGCVQSSMLHGSETWCCGIWGSHQKSGLPYPPDRIFRLSRHECACV